MQSLTFVQPTPMTDALYEYSLAVGLREPDLFRALREETGRLTNCEMQIAPEQGPFLAMLVQLLGAKNCLEVGTFTGYSSLWVASALPPDGKLICCDVSEEYTALARKYWASAGLAAKIDLRQWIRLNFFDCSGLQIHQFERDEFCVFIGLDI